jgi:hypothetical protein
MKRRRPRQREGHFLSGGDVELADRPPILAAKVDLRVEDQSVRSGGELAPPVFAPTRPRNN